MKLIYVNGPIVLFYLTIQSNFIFIWPMIMLVENQLEICVLLVIGKAVMWQWSRGIISQVILGYMCL